MVGVLCIVYVGVLSCNISSHLPLSFDYSIISYLIEGAVVIVLLLSGFLLALPLFFSLLWL